MSVIVVGGGKPRTARTVHSDSVSVVNPAADRNTREFEYETTMSYRNGLTYPIKVVHRNGFAVVIPPLPSGLKSTTDFIVEVTYTYTKNVILDTNHILGVINDRTRPEVVALNKAVTQTKPVHFKQGNAFVLAYVISRESLDIYGREVYVDDLDITLTADIHSVDVKHTESLEGRLLRMWDAIDKSFQYRVDIVDPVGVFGDRYMNIGGEVFQLVACSDYTRPPGVYHYTKERRVHEIYEDSGAGYISYSFKEADEKMPWYLTHAEAEAHGDLSLARKQEFEARKHELNVRAQEIEEQQQQNRLELMGQEHSLKEMQLEKERTILELRERLDRIDGEHKERLAEHKAEVLRLEGIAKAKENALAEEKYIRERMLLEERHRYENRSMDRKDSSEMVKWLPSIIGGGLLLAKILL